MDNKTLNKRIFFSLGLSNKNFETQKDVQYHFQGLSNLNNRLNSLGGAPQQNRMIAEKKESLIRAINFSYQGATLQKNDDSKVFLGLMNPNKLKPDYDEKILSTEYENNMKPGDVFKWKETGSYWIIYLQDLTELAYFRGNVRRCSYRISWEDNGKRHFAYAALRGPVETRLNSIKAHEISIDNPNYSLHLLLPKDKDSVSYFKRYTKFYLNGSETCWRVEAVDEFSTPGILEVNATEYYSNTFEDDIKQGVVGGLRVEENLLEDFSLIQGPNLIKPKIKYTFSCSKNEGDWSFEGKYLEPLKIKEKTPQSITLFWDALYEGSFVLKFGNETKKIKIKSVL